MSDVSWQINDLEYLEAPGLSALMFHNTYPGGKQGGIEIVQHGERIATNGDLRLEVTPGQWAALPELSERTVDREAAVVAVSLRYPQYDLDYRLRLQARGSALYLALDLERSLPPELVGKASLQLELYPPAYFCRTYHLGDSWGVFPRQANGPVMANAGGDLEPVPMAVGKRLSIAAEDPHRRMAIECAGGTLALLDGRVSAPNGWFVVRSPVPSESTRGAVEWTILPHSVLGWRREPVICVSQVGYHPDQEKRAIIELDARTEDLGKAVLLSLEPTGAEREVLSLPLEHWGLFLRYAYGVFDFGVVRTPGMYRVRYGERTSAPFRIASDVYEAGVWQPTLETYFPVQMCHMEVRDRSRVWHGACHLDDALRAPPDCVHFDGYQQGPATETPYAAYQHIPGLDRGGWHDAGDYDLAAGSQASTVLLLSLARETFGLNSDQTTVHPEERLVLLHTPDGIPDVVEQIAHGARNLLSGYRAAGHSFSGIIAGSLAQYVHLGDASTMTDNLVYDPALGAGEQAGDRAGRRDDRWAFTSRDTALEYKVIAALAAASRTLRGYHESLAEECLSTALAAWTYEAEHEPAQQRSAYVPRNADVQEVLAACELLVTTGEARYRKRVLESLPVIRVHWAETQAATVRVLPQIGEPSFAAEVRSLLEQYKLRLDDELAETPFGVPFRPRIWGVGWDVQQYAVDTYYLVKACPDLFGREYVLRALNFVLGCHPGSDVSFVSGVGNRSLTAAYGVNRAEWSYIPGGVVSGTGLIRPDLPELKDDFPFLWQQAEYVMSGAASYLFCVLAAQDLLRS